MSEPFLGEVEGRVAEIEDQLKGLDVLQQQSRQLLVMTAEANDNMAMHEAKGMLMILGELKKGIQARLKSLQVGP